ncbi:MAG: amidohydrolase family protein [Phycisphaerales bacterium]|nr:amidohydrolase family protein [Phycisphaerales bacterium]
MNERLVLELAAGVADGTGMAAAPGAVLAAWIQGRPGTPARVRVLAAGRAAEIAGTDLARSAAPRDHGPGTVLVPALVNAHTHLDLTHIGPQPYDPTLGFAGWGGIIIRNRAREPQAIAASVRDGLRRSVAGGVLAIGDIAGVGRLEPYRVMSTPWPRGAGGDSADDGWWGGWGVSYVEFFGVGSAQEGAAAAINQVISSEPRSGPGGRVRLGLSPHAPYSAGLRLYRDAGELAGRLNIPLTTHLAENPEEREFIAAGTGTVRSLLETLGKWDAAALEEIGRGVHPVAHLGGVLAARPWLVAHVNDATDEAIEVLARSGTSIAYCPRCSAYFLHHETFGPHRYREMLSAGINVCLGTDSVVNLPAEEADRLSTLDEIRYLWRRDATDPVTLLKMATVNGARALGIDPALFCFDRRGTGGSGGVAGIAAVDVRGTDPTRPPAERVASSRGRPREPGVRLLEPPG